MSRVPCISSFRTPYDDVEDLPDRCVECDRPITDEDGEEVEGVLEHLFCSEACYAKGLAREKAQADWEASWDARLTNEEAALLEHHLVRMEAEREASMGVPAEVLASEEGITDGQVAALEAILARNAG